MAERKLMKGNNQKQNSLNPISEPPPPHWALEHWYVTLRPKWVISEPNAEMQKVVNPVILDDRKYIQNQGLAENISKT